MSSVRDLVVIVPVYNTMPELRDCLDSLVDQDLENDRYEVVAVNDGSTDGSGELLDEYAARHANVRVLHQENSGWPGQPRNRALEASDSRYVFFADADDQLGRESLRRQVEFADRYGCDIVVPMLSSRPEEHPRGSIWAANAVDADRALLFKTLSPQKLFRRSFLKQHDLRFPEGRVPLEDGLVVSRAYLLANRVSILADYEYYYKRPREQGGNISMRGKSPAQFIDSVTKILDIVREYAPDEETADRIVLDIYRRKALKYLRADRFTRYSQRTRRNWLKAIGELTRSHVSIDLEARLPADAQLRSQAARLGDEAVASSLADAVNASTVPAWIQSGRIMTRLPETHGQEDIDITERLPMHGSLVYASTSRDEFHLQVDVSTPPFTVDGAEWQIAIRIRGASPGNDVIVPLRASRRRSRTRGTRMTCSVPSAQLGGNRQRWNVYLRLRPEIADIPAESRLKPHEGNELETIQQGLIVAGWHIALYVTSYGNISFRSDKAGKAEFNQAVQEGSMSMIDRSRLRARWHFRDLANRAVEHPLPRRALNAVPARHQRLARSAARRVRQVQQGPEPLRELLSQLRINVRSAGQDTVVVSRRRQLDVTNVDSDTAVITSRAGASETSVYETHKALYERMVTEHVVQMFHTYGVNCVLDVGANKGQYARKLRKAGYQGHIISFEPVPDTFEQLQRAAEKDPRWSVQHCALGNTEGTMPMHVVAGTMSSLLPASEYGGRRYKRFRNESAVDVPIRRLEQLLDSSLPTELANARIYLKLDTQGYDLEAFAGLGERARDVVAMQSEVALLQIYEGMPRLPQAIETYEAAGFEITGMFPVTREKDTGRVLEFDCVLARADTIRH